jgi:G3E family GTPase
MTVKIPATVITGFLGAGKTSLIRHLLEHSSGRRLALLINEFGNLGIDRGIIHPKPTSGSGTKRQISSTLMFAIPSVRRQSY